jgi:hypothetical protein
MNRNVSITDTVNAISIGDWNPAGQVSCGNNSINMGQDAGRINAPARSINLGQKACEYSNFTPILSATGSFSINIGFSAGSSFDFLTGPGQFSISIGANALATQNNSIVINATGVQVGSLFNDSCYIAPIRQFNPAFIPSAKPLYYNNTTKEVFYST